MAKDPVKALTGRCLQNTKCEFDAIKLVRRYDLAPLKNAQEFRQKMMTYAAQRKEAIEAGKLGWSDLLVTIMEPFLRPIMSSPWIFVPFLCIFVYLIRFVLVSQTTLMFLMSTIFGPFMEQAGMSLYVLMFVQYMSAYVWNTNYQNPTILGVIRMSNKVVYKDAQKISFLYLLLNLLGFVLSIPVWKMLGHIW